MKKLYNNHFPTPSYLTMNPCAIDISDQSIKYGKLVITSSGLRLDKYGREKIEKGIVVSGKIEKEEELIKILKKIKEKENLYFVRVSLPEEQMYLFTLSLPKGNSENLRDMILLQIEEHIPLKATDSVFDYDIISEDDKNVLVEVTAISSIIIESYLLVFNRAGLSPVSFEIEAQAIARAVIPSGDNSSIMIVDFGDARTGVSICKNGHVFLTTTLSIGGLDLTNMIAKNFSLSFEEAEKMKHEYSLNQTSKAQNIFPAILNGLSVLRDELNKQCAYWETHNINNAKNEKIDKIILCGGDANLAGLSEYLEISMKIKVENANIWVNVFNTQSLIPKISFEHSLSYATVVGLSLGSYANKLQPVINILPVEEKKIIEKEFWVRFFTMLLILMSLTGIVASLLVFPSYVLSQLREKLAENSLESFNKENPDIVNNNIDTITSGINSKLEIIEKTKALYQINDKILNDILMNQTEGVNFSQIIFTKNTVEKTMKDYSATLEIHGTAKNRDSLRNLKTTLDKNTNFFEVNLPVSNFIEKTNPIFTISIKIK